MINISTTMETQNPSEKPAALDYHSTVDTSRPFQSVKEAVAIFGERLLFQEAHSPKPFSFPKQESSWYKYSPRSTNTSPSTSTHQHELTARADEPSLGDTLKKLENELEETKIELNLLKERESETEVALASLNAELHKNMSKMARAEAAAAGKAVAATRSASFCGNGEGGLSFRMENSPTLAQILSIGEKEGLLFGGMKERKVVKKKKPVIPLVKDLFSRKKGPSSNNVHDCPLYSSSQGYSN